MKLIHFVQRNWEINVRFLAQRPEYSVFILIRRLFSPNLISWTQGRIFLEFKVSNCFWCKFLSKKVSVYFSFFEKCSWSFYFFEDYFLLSWLERKTGPMHCATTFQVENYWKVTNMFSVVYTGFASVTVWKFWWNYGFCPNWFPFNLSFLTMQTFWVEAQSN